MNTTFRSLKIAACAAVAALYSTSASFAGTSAESVPNVTAGRASVYTQLPAGSLENLSTPERISAVTGGSVGPTEIWRTLEHGEKVECLSCIPDVAKLLFDGNRKNREIGAWWLRRRIFGVFGPGEVYSQVLDTLKNDGSATKRAYAAEALGEFLIADGIAPVARAVVGDSSAMVRLSGVRALERLNTQGPGYELATAIGDSSPDVQVAALDATVRINVFTKLDAVVAQLSSSNADVRRRAAEVAGTMRATDAVVSLIALSSPDQESDARVRTAAVAALGQIADSAARDAVEAALSDEDPLVQSVARIAARRL